jgi:hypothetical protein
MRMRIVSDLIGVWLSLPVPLMLAALLLLEVSCAAGAYWFVVGQRTREFVHRNCMAPPVVVVPITVMFSLLAGFLAAEIGQRDASAKRCVADEGRALMTIEALTQTSPSRFGDVRDAARKYAVIAAEEEFPRFGEHGESPGAKAALADLERMAAGHAFDAGNAGVVADRMMQAVLLLQQSRAERVLIRQGNSGFQWITVLSLSLLCIVAIALSHADKPQAAIAAWWLFIPAMFVVQGVLAVRENPFSPPISVSPAPLEGAVRCLSTDAGEAAAP